MANGRTSIFDVSYDFVKKGVFERKQCFFLANAITLILILTSYRSRALVRFSMSKPIMH